MDEQELRKLIDQKMSIRMIAKTTNKSIGSIRYWLKKYGLKTYFEPLVLDIENVKKAAEESTSLCQMIKKLNMTVSTSSYKRLRSFIKEYNIDTSHFTPKKNQNAKGVSNKELFIKSAKHSATTVKRRIVQEKLLPMDHCAICGMEPLWNNKPLTFRLDHINGDHYDNRLENLRFICPNCDSQLDTFCHKNKHRNK